MWPAQDLPHHANAAINDRFFTVMTDFCTKSLRLLNELDKNLANAVTCTWERGWVRPRTTTSALALARIVVLRGWPSRARPVASAFNELSAFLDEDTKTTTPKSLFGTFWDFFDALDRASADLRQAAEKEKQAERRERQAEAMKKHYKQLPQRASQEPTESTLTVCAPCVGREVQV